jgi:hypothetical protein
MASGLALHFCCTEEELALIANDATMYCLGRDAESAPE